MTTTADGTTHPATAGLDLDTLKREHRIFVDGGVIQGSLPAELLTTGPYVASKSIR